jgi:L-proline amide hydrolase
LTSWAGSLVSLMLASSPSSIPEWVEETGRLRRALPDDVEAVLNKHEAAGTTDDPEYEQACEVFYRRHVCRAPEWPDYVMRSLEFIAQHGEVYRYMNARRHLRARRCDDRDQPHRLAGDPVS